MYGRLYSEFQRWYRTENYRENSCYREERSHLEINSDCAPRNEDSLPSRIRLPNLVSVKAKYQRWCLCTSYQQRPAAVPLSRRSKERVGPCGPRSTALVLPNYSEIVLEDNVNQSIFVKYNCGQNLSDWAVFPGLDKHNHHCISYQWMYCAINTRDPGSIS